MLCSRCGLDAKRKHDDAADCVFDLRQAAFAAELECERARRRGEETRTLQRRASELCNRITEIEISMRERHP